jgi:histone H4
MDKCSLLGYRKILRDNIQGITQGSIRRLARRSGVKRISATVYDEVRTALKTRLTMVGYLPPLALS